LLACLQTIVKDLSWELDAPPALDEPTEETKIRVKYLRNPYSDNHFDLLHGNPLMGKTMAILAPALNDKTMAASLELLGWTLFGDWQKLQSRIKSVDALVFKEALDLAQKYILKAQEAEGHTVPAGLAESLQSVKSVAGNLLETLEGLIKKTVTEHESKDIEAQEKRYKQWEQDRQHMLAKQLRKNEIKQRTQAVEEKKKYLQEKEQLLSFFENEDKYDLLIEELEKDEEKRKLEDREIKTEDKDDYVPPEVEKRHTPSA
jgi:small subunit ribosomal protein S27